MINVKVSRRSWVCRVMARGELSGSKVAIVIMLMLLAVPVRAEDGLVSCPKVSPSNNIYSSHAVYRDSVVALEMGDAQFPVFLALYRKTDGLCVKKVVDRYPVEGSSPNVQSLFFEMIKGKENLLLIVRWEVNHRGIGTYGDFYKIYAYENDGAGWLKTNKEVGDMKSLRGIDGYQDGQSSNFDLKDAAAVRKYLRDR